MPKMLPKKRIKPPLMVVPTASTRKTYKYHAPPKVKGTNTELFLPTRNLPTISLSF